MPQHHEPRVFRPTSVAALVSLLVFEITVFLVKTVALFAAGFRFGRPLTILDGLTAFSLDSVLTVVGLAALGGIILLERGLGKSVLRSQAHRIAALLEVLIVLAVFASTALYLFSGFLFWEWGAFLESQHIMAIRTARVSDGITGFLFRREAVVPAVGLVIVAVLFSFLYRSMRASASVQKVFAIVLLTSLTLGLSAPLAIQRRRRLDPLTVSPLLEFIVSPAENAAALPDNIPRPPRADFAPAGNRPVHDRYVRLAGAANGMNVIFVILESVRARDISLYGYSRDTMPHLSELAGRGIVFHQAYVNQPRSSKTLESLTLGTYPDPRLTPVTWSGRRVAGKANLFNTLKEQNYSLYFGTTQKRGGDCFDRFMEQVSGGLSRNVGIEDLGPQAKPRFTMGDDSVLVRDYLQWQSGQKGKTAAVLWFVSAHFPYDAVHQKFAPDSILQNRYDDCLFSSDLAIGRLVAALRRSGQLDKTLLVIFGDHGEALGENLDSGHGSYLYDYSLHVPFVVSNPSIFPSRMDDDARFQMKDVPATIFYLLGIERPLHQSENIFTKSAEDTIYLCNVYQDYKLGLIRGRGEKFVYRPRYGVSYLFDMRKDPDEQTNRIRTLSAAQVRALERIVVQWYFYSLDTINREFPVPSGPPIYCE